MARPTIAILASHQGSTAEAFIRAGVNDTTLPLVSLIICNNRTAGIGRRIAGLNAELGSNIKINIINGLTHPPAADEKVYPGRQTAAEERAILEALEAGSFAAVVLMGYMKKTGLKLINRYGWRSEYSDIYQASMLNTHPGLLPFSKGFYGINLQQHVLDNHNAESGQTLHIAAENYDEGPVIAEHKVAVEPGDTAESLFRRVQLTEKRYLPGDVAEFVRGRQQYLSHQGAEHG